MPSPVGLARVQMIAKNAIAIATAVEEYRELPRRREHLALGENLGGLVCSKNAHRPTTAPLALLALRFFAVGIPVVPVVSLIGVMGFPHFRPCRFCFST